MPGLVPGRLGKAKSRRAEHRRTIICASHCLTASLFSDGRSPPRALISNFGNPVLGLTRR